MEYSKTEQELHIFLKKNQKTSIQKIKDNLGEKYLGAIGKLMKDNKIEKIKKLERKDDYTSKMVTYYIIKKENIKEE